MVQIDKENRVDWHSVKAEYVAGGISQKKLAQKHGIPFTTLQKRAARENWVADRTDACAKVVENVVQKTADIAADNATIAENIKRKGLLLLEKLFDDYMQYTVTEHRESGEGRTDVKRLRDLTAAYKDLTEDIPKAGDDRNAPIYDLLKKLDGECDV